MSISVEFFGGPMDGSIKEIQDDNTPYILIAKPAEPLSLQGDLPDAVIAVVKGRYEKRRRLNGRIVYEWAGWEDELPKMQEDKGD
jgi:hypothetical protein